MTMRFLHDSAVPDTAPYSTGKKLLQAAPSKRHLRRKLEALQRKLAKHQAKNAGSNN
jgi:hypothetical protein